LFGLFDPEVTESIKAFLSHFEPLLVILPNLIFSAELKVKANKRSMVEYSKLEIQWLTKMIESSSVDQEIKNSLLDKSTSAGLKLDQAILNIDSGKIKTANNMLSASQNIMSAFINQVEAQYDKKIMQPDTIQLEEKADQIMENVEKAKSN